jgi:hypothetical protein
MFSTLRPVIRQAARASSRTYTTGGARSSSTLIRNTILGGSALAAVSYALGQRQAVLLDESSKRVPRESVLDGHTLKEPIHRREGESPPFDQVGRC